MLWMTLYCSPRKTLVDHGRYYLNMSDDGTCSFTITNSPINSNLRTFCSQTTVMTLRPKQYCVCWHRLSVDAMPETIHRPHSSMHSLQALWDDTCQMTFCNEGGGGIHSHNYKIYIVEMKSVSNGIVICLTHRQELLITSVIIICHWRPVTSQCSDR